MKLDEETELIRLKNRYARYLDAGRIDDFVSLFMPDAVLNLGEIGSARASLRFELSSSK